MIKLSEINNIEEFKEYATSITRENFMSLFTYDDRDVETIDGDENKICPNQYGIKDSDCPQDCADCWTESIKGISFKYGIEEDNKISKEVKIMEINTLEDFKKFTATITRKEFEDNYLRGDKDNTHEGFRINNKVIFDCPDDISLQEMCTEHNSCKKCWINSVKGVYFKDDIRNCELIKNIEKNSVKPKDSITYDYDKEYSLAEVFEFIDDTIFISKGYKTKINRDVLFIYKEDEEIWEQCCINKEWLSRKFKLVPIEKEVTFAEILTNNSKCKIKVKHDLIKEMGTDILNDYMSFQMYMLELCDCDNLDEDDIKEIIKDGKWFMKEDENKYA